MLHALQHSSLHPAGVDSGLPNSPLLLFLSFHLHVLVLHFGQDADARLQVVHRGVVLRVVHALLLVAEGQRGVLRGGQGLLGTLVHRLLLKRAHLQVLVHVLVPFDLFPVFKAVSVQAWALETHFLREMPVHGSLAIVG